MHVRLVAVLISFVQSVSTVSAQIKVTFCLTRQRGAINKGRQKQTEYFLGETWKFLLKGGHAKVHHDVLGLSHIF
jgi:hypothetical protein